MKSNEKCSAEFYENTKLLNASLQAGRTASKLLGVEAEDLFSCITKPKVKVGAEFVAKGVNAEQCYISVRAIAKALYERVFKWLATKCNVILENGLEPAFFIGVLDISGFEIFDVSDSHSSLALWPPGITHNNTRKITTMAVYGIAS